MQGDAIGERKLRAARRLDDLDLIGYVRVLLRQRDCRHAIEVATHELIGVFGHQQVLHRIDRVEQPASLGENFRALRRIG